MRLFHWTTGRFSHEKDVSTQQPEAQESAWIPVENEDQERARRFVPPPVQGEEEDRRLKPFPFPRVSRLQGKKNFGLVFQKGIRLRTQYMNLYFYPVPEGPLRTGVVMPGSSGAAIVRNRIKRRLRELLRNHPDLLPLSAGFFVLQFKQRIEPPFDVLHNDFLLGLKRLRACLRS